MSAASIDESKKPIGVFDSGVGGLTVLNELKKQLPGEDLIYLGDTARVPYGTKSALSVTRYARQAAQALVDRDIKLLVLACNTVSAVAVEPLQVALPNLLVVGVVEPGAEASCKATRNGHIGVIATESTVSNQAYQRAILTRRPDATIQAQACSLFVALAEEGWHDGDLVEQIVAKCLSPIIEASSNSLTGMDTLVLGCTHFPALKASISRVLGGDVALVDSAETTARYVAGLLSDRALLNEQSEGQVQFMVTDGPERFARVAPCFFSGSVEPSAIELVDIQHFGG